MPRYRWEIRTGDTWYAGTDANVYLSLAGDKNNMKEMELNDPDSDNDWERGEVNHGLFETADLGFLKTGTLRHDGKGAGPDWTVDYVRITNDEDGRIWLAGVQKELGADSPFRLSFKLEDRGQYDEIQRRLKEDAAAKERADADSEQAIADAEAERVAQEQEKAFKAEMQKQKLELQRQITRLKAQQELDNLRAQAGLPPLAGGGGTGAGTIRTIELFGMINGQTVPLVQAVQGGQIVPGARVLRGDSPSDGFGLGGTPGRWSAFYGAASPAEYGLPPNTGVLGSDGSRGWVLSAQALQQIFGSNWASVIA